MQVKRKCTWSWMCCQDVGHTANNNAHLFAHNRDNHVGQHWAASLSSQLQKNIKSTSTFVQTPTQWCFLNWLHCCCMHWCWDACSVTHKFKQKLFQKMATKRKSHWPGFQFKCFKHTKRAMATKTVWSHRMTHLKKTCPTMLPLFSPWHCEEWAQKLNRHPHQEASSEEGSNEWCKTKFLQLTACWGWGEDLSQCRLRLGRARGYCM